MSAVSIVIPVYAGESYLENLVARLAQVREQWMTDHPEVYLAETLLVNDAAQDDSARIIAKLEEEYPWVHSLTLSKNFGQHPATVAGILHSSGDWIATLDEDLQHPPEHIETMLRRAVTEHADVVYGAADTGAHGSWRRDLSSKAFKQLLSSFTGNAEIRHFSSFRMCRGTVARAAGSVAGHETYLDVSLTWFTDRFSVESLPMVDCRFQESGASGYSFPALLAHARRLIISSHSRVTRLAGYLGTAAIVLAAFFATRVVVARIAGTEDVYVPGWASLFVGLLFFGGLIVFLLVVILEYMMNVVLHTQGKPTFFIVDRAEDDEVAARLGACHGDPVT